jgi:hypothetical protein
MFIPDPNFSIPDLNFSIPDLGSKRFRIPDLNPHQRIFAQKTVSKLSEKLSGLFVPDPGSGFFPPNPGSRDQKAPDPGS